MAYEASGHEVDGERIPRRRRGWRPVYWLLVIPFVGVLIPPIDNREAPEVLGLTFFYWYQFLWIPLSVLCTVLVYRATRGEG